MVNAFYSSQEGGTRTFEDENGDTFGWKSIIDMLAWECQCRDSGHAQMVPKLREVRIICDSWTKLMHFQLRSCRYCYAFYFVCFVHVYVCAWTL